MPLLQQQSDKEVVNHIKEGFIAAEICPLILCPFVYVPLRNNEFHPTHGSVVVRIRIIEENQAGLPDFGQPFYTRVVIGTSENDTSRPSCRWTKERRTSHNEFSRGIMYSDLGLLIC